MIEIKKDYSLGKAIVDATKTELGGKMETISLNGTPLGVMAFINDDDRQRGIKMLSDVIDSLGRDPSPWDVMKALNSIASLNDKGVHPDESITIDGVDYLISYADKKLYSTSGDEVADCSDITDDMSPTVLKEMLTLKLKASLERSRQEANTIKMIDLYDLDDEI